MMRFAVASFGRAVLWRRVARRIVRLNRRKTKRLRKMDEEYRWFALNEKMVDEICNRFGHVPFGMFWNEGLEGKRKSLLILQKTHSSPESDTKEG
jgi:hypothetical protein